MEAFGLEFEQIDDAQGGNWGQTLWGCAFENFLTRRFEPENENPVEACLKRRGWKERVATRAYMAALQGSVNSNRPNRATPEGLGRAVGIRKGTSARLV